MMYKNNRTIIRKGLDRITSPYLTKYEISRIIGLRGNQIKNGARILHDMESESLSSEPCLESGNCDAVKNAFRELISGKIPFKLRRRISSNIFEEWCCDELQILCIDSVVRSFNAM